MEKANLLNHPPFGDLTVKRDLGDDLFHANCSCGGSRQVTRKQLLRRDVDCCVACAIKRRKGVGRPPKGMPEPALPPEPIRVEKALVCKGCYRDKETGLVATPPDCPRHGIVRIDPRLAQKGAAMGL